MGSALTLHEEFFTHVAEIRAGADPSRVAARYIRRDQGQRVRALSLFFEIAAEAEPHPDHRHVKTAVWNVGMKAWWVDGPLEPGQPQRALRWDVVDTFSLAAIRVARRGAGRCAQPECAAGRGAKLASDTRGDHCRAHEWLDRKPRAFVEIDRALFDSLVPLLLDERDRRDARAA